MLLSGWPTAFQARLTAGETITVAITARNAGALTWSWGGGNPFRLGYRYYRNRRLLTLAPDKDLRSDIPDDIHARTDRVIQARIALPDTPGNYTLEIDLVHEGVAWFKERGATVLTRWLTVEAPANGTASNGGEALLPVRLFTDISRRLARSDAPYARRNVNQIRYIVVNHTGAHPLLSLDRIARAHIRRGLAGHRLRLSCRRCRRDSQGQGDLEDVAQPDQPWSEQGVNICLAGNFEASAPPLAQLDAAGRLCAWLAQNMGLAADAIVGLGELTPSESPGATFYKGARWKDVLARQVRLHLAALSTGALESDRADEVERRLTELRDLNQTLAVQLAAVTAREHAAQSTIQQMRQEVDALRLQVETQPAAVEGGLRIYNVADRLSRQAGRYTVRRPADVQAIVVYDTGAAPDTPLEQLAALHRQNWPGILYDFVVTTQGMVQQTQPLDAAPDTPEAYVRQAISIAFAGDFRSGGAPSPEQLAAGGALIVWLLTRFPHLTLAEIKGIGESIETPSPWQRVDARRQLEAATARRSAPRGRQPGGRTAGRGAARRDLTAGARGRCVASRTHRARRRPSRPPGRDPAIADRAGRQSRRADELCRAAATDSGHDRPVAQTHAPALRAPSAGADHPHRHPSHRPRRSA
jgi:hypothetical protein